MYWGVCEDVSPIFIYVRQNFLCVSVFKKVTPNWVGTHLGESGTMELLRHVLTLGCDSFSPDDLICLNMGGLDEDCIC